MNLLDWDGFTQIELRVGRIVRAEPFPEARKPAYKLVVDFGPDIGQRKSSAQVTDLYGLDDLIGKLVVAVVNFPPKRIGPFLSECLVTGFHDKQGQVALCVADRLVPLGLNSCNDAGFSRARPKRHRVARRPAPPRSALASKSAAF